jgi:hypothetical protein
MPDLRRLSDVIKPGKTDQGDGLTLQPSENEADCSDSCFGSRVGHQHDH